MHELTQQGLDVCSHFLLYPVRVISLDTIHVSTPFYLMFLINFAFQQHDASMSVTMVTLIQPALLYKKSSHSLHSILDILWENLWHNPPSMRAFSVFDEFHWSVKRHNTLFQLARAID